MPFCFNASSEEGAVFSMLRKMPLLVSSDVVTSGSGSGRRAAGGAISPLASVFT